MKYGGGETLVQQGTVVAKIVDERGAPVADQPVYLCGIDLCSAPGKTAANGAVTLQTNLMMKRPAFKYGDALNYAELAIPLTSNSSDFTSGNRLLATGKLSDKPGAPLTPGQSATSGDVTLSIPNGATVGIDLLTYATLDQQKLRTVNIPLTNLGPVFAGVMAGNAPANFALVYGVAPAETILCPAAKVTVALPRKTAMMYNDLGWAPGSAVEFWVMTTDTGQTFAPYAGWAKMSDGVVSNDGASVTTLDGVNEGFIFLETFAIRKAN